MTVVQRALGAIMALVLAFGAVWWFFMRDGEGSSGEWDIQTAQAELADVRRIVTASGAVRALVTVEVGSQLSGKVDELFVDFNDRVEAGQIIARIDPQTFQTRVREAEASRAVAQANVELQRASLQRAAANARTAGLEYERIQTLAERGNASRAALQNAEAANQSAQAELDVARAQIANAEAVLQQREATLEGVRIDLERAAIRAPINGVVVDRAVDEGQTVAASLSAPTLFTIAQDLTEVQIDAQIDEADIGQISEGQPVSFTVDAYRDRRLEARVEQIRLAPTTLQNVVTYTVVISADNPDELLLPGMTANLDIITGERTGVLTVPNAALRFRPPAALEARSVPAAEPQRGGGRPGGGGGGPGQGGGQGGGGNPMARLTEQLDLSDDQAEQVQRAFRAAFGRAAAAAQSGGEFDREAVQAEISTAMQGILSPEQLEQYRRIQAEARERRPGAVWVLDADGQFVERRVLLGINDSQRTEIVGGQLEAGETVITRVREAE